MVPLGDDRMGAETISYTLLLIVRIYDDLLILINFIFKTPTNFITIV